MTYKKRMPLATAEVIAILFQQLLPVESHIAGSIRRCSEEVGDIDIVAVGTFPKLLDGAEYKSG